MLYCWRAPNVHHCRNMHGCHFFRTRFVQYDHFSALFFVLVCVRGRWDVFEVEETIVIALNSGVGSAAQQLSMAVTKDIESNDGQ